MIEVLDPNRPTLEAREARDVAGRVDVRLGRAQPVVDEDAVVDAKARPGGELYVGHDADSHDHRVGFELPAVANGDPHDAGFTVDRRNAGLEQRAHAVPVEKPLRERRDVLAEAFVERAVDRDDGDLAAAAAQRRGYLHPDEAAADHDDAPRTRAHAAQARRVQIGAQQVDAVEIGSIDVEPARNGAGREQQPAVADRSGGSLERLRTRVEPGDLDAGEQPDVVLEIPCAREHEDVRERSAVLQKLL